MLAIRSVTCAGVTKELHSYVSAVVNAVLIPLFLVLDRHKYKSPASLGVCKLPGKSDGDHQ